MPLPAVAASYIIAGSSATSAVTAVQSSGRDVCLAIQTENWSKFTQADSEVTIKKGNIKVSPSSVLPSYREGMVAVNSRNVPAGSYGTVSWLLEGKKRRVVVMWSVSYPSMFNVYDNWLGLGITMEGITEDEDDWFEQMYYGDPKTSKKLIFQRRCYKDTADEFEVADNDFEVSGIMETTAKTEAKITVRPKKTGDYADKIRELLKK